ncbi:MAG: sigma 54-interacting transcriptional regulator [Gemmatimonadales bacterium]
MPHHEIAYWISFVLRLGAVGFACWYLSRLRSIEGLIVVGLTAIAASVQLAVGPLPGVRTYAFTLPFTAVVWLTVWFTGRSLVQRREAYRRLRRSEADLRATLESVSDAVFTTGASGAIDFVSPSAARLFGRPADQLQGTHVGAILGDAFPPSEGSLNSWPHALAAAAGERRVLIDAKPVADHGPSRTLYVCRDVTEQRDAETALQEALTQVSQLQERLEAENVYLRDEVRQHRAFEHIVGHSDALHAVLRKVEQVAETDATVLITGETGVGKELFARAVHGLSRRKKRSLVRVNCSTLPAPLIESELFGHERGAFTGATARRAGRVSLAHEGTILLDEIGDLPLELQPKLLRVLQEGEFERLGGTETIKVDVRVIASTNRDLAADVEAKRFRADLYFRLNVFPIVVPPLRERSEDVPELAHFFLERCQRTMHRPLNGLSKGSVERLVAYGWPGNVRELENVIERAAIAAEGPVVHIGPFEEVSNGSDRRAVGKLEDVERAHIIGVLEHTNWVVEGSAGAAAILGMNPSTLRSRLKKLRISRPG